MADLPKKVQQTVKPVTGYRSIYQNRLPVDLSKTKSKEFSGTVTGAVQCETITQNCHYQADAFYVPL